MTKFGELIDEQKPILLNFFAEWSEDCENIHDQLKDVSAALGDRAKLIKIDAEKNSQLVEALKVKKLPTYMLYKSGEMVWRQSGKLEANDLIILLEDNS
ncbi:thioredoxin family protein [Psychroflexus montanilacus]|uniref:thioredoxin family protein n=1 Tax=Psychroflexus montanilacus TaxID=2873598 RepID=UPI001CCC2DE2|nr:thioredoxin family protein [Psychroflexus montanilacus]MBZ9652462.1 thioredoxin family protein [Psychroflexus montanilacus]